MNPDRKLTLTLDKIINSTAEKAYEAFTDPAMMSRWFSKSAKAELAVGGRYSNADGDSGEFLSLNPPRRVSFTWENAGHCPGTVVSVTFARRPAGAVRVILEHSGLNCESDYEDMKGGWSWALDSFKSFLETGKPIPHEEWLKTR